MSLPNNIHEEHTTNHFLLLLLLFIMSGFGILFLPCLFKNLHLAMALRPGHAGGQAGLGLGLGLGLAAGGIPADWTGLDWDGEDD